MFINSSKIIAIISVLFLTSCIETMFSAADWAKDIGKSEGWKTLALQGDAEAQFKVGQLYCCGERPRYDNVKALYWHCRAAMQGQRDAMFEVGKIYETEHSHEGSVIPRDNTLAYTYYSLAVLQGNDKAKKFRESVAKKLSDAEKHEANEHLMNWPRIPCSVSR